MSAQLRASGASWRLEAGGWWPGWLTGKQRASADSQIIISDTNKMIANITRIRAAAPATAAAELDACALVKVMAVAVSQVVLLPLLWR